MFDLMVGKKITQLKSVDHLRLFNYEHDANVVVRKNPDIYVIGVVFTYGSDEVRWTVVLK